MEQQELNITKKLNLRRKQQLWPLEDQKLNIKKIKLEKKTKAMAFGHQEKLSKMKKLNIAKKLNLKRKQRLL